MAERERAVLVLRFRFHFHGLLRLLNLSEEDHDEANDEDGQGNQQGRGGIGNLGFGGLADERTHEDVNRNGSRRVEYPADLDELVTFVAAAAEQVQHGIDDGVQHAHAETGDEGSDEIDPETHAAAGPLHEDADDAHGKGHQSGLFVAELLDEHTRRDTHD